MERNLKLRKGVDFVCEDGGLRLTRNLRSDFSIGFLKEATSYAIALTKSEAGVLVATTKSNTSLGLSSKAHSGKFTWSPLP